MNDVSSVSCRWKAKLKFSEVAADMHVDESGVEPPDVRSSSVTTFERLQEEIIELESIKRRLNACVCEDH